MTTATTQTANSSRISFTLTDDLLDAISEQAHQARPGRAVLGFLGAVLFAIGWVTAKALRGFFYCFAWAWAATSVGWRQARGEPAHAPSMEQLLAENEMLRLELRRISPTMS